MDRRCHACILSMLQKSTLSASVLEIKKCPFLGGIYYSDLIPCHRLCPVQGGCPPFKGCSTVIVFLGDVAGDGR